MIFIAGRPFKGDLWLGVYGVGVFKLLGRGGLIVFFVGGAVFKFHLRFESIIRDVLSPINEEVLFLRIITRL